MTANDNGGIIFELWKEGVKIMQSYEHIMATIIQLSKYKKDSKNLSLEDNLNFMRKYGAYFTYPDSIRTLVRLSTDSSFRQPSHMSDGAWMEFIIGEELKSSVDGFPKEKIHIPDGLEIKGADSPTDLEEAKKHNQEVLETVEGKAILKHLKQDSCTDKFFQGYMAKCYIDENEYDINVDEEEAFKLYGAQTKPGYALFVQTGNIVTMKTFRKIVARTQELTTLELFKRLKEIYPDITFQQIQEAMCESYDNCYPEPMQYAKQFVVPTQEEQERLLNTLATQDYTYYEGVKSELVNVGAFKSTTDVDKKINELIDNVIRIPHNIMEKSNCNEENEMERD